jgi:hypothetical protein
MLLNARCHCSDEFFGASRTTGGVLRGRARDKFYDPVPSGKSLQIYL